MIRRRNSCLALLLLLALLLPAAGCAGAKQRYPEARRFFREVYGDWVKWDEDGEPVWCFGGKTEKIAAEDYELFESPLFRMEYVDVVRLPELGTVLRYGLYMDGGFGPDRYPMRAEASVYEYGRYTPLLQVWLDGRWWTLEVQDRPGLGLNVWLNPGFPETLPRFTFPMESRQTGRCFPAGKYRLLLPFAPDEIGMAADLGPPPEEGIVLALEFEHEPETVPAPETMADRYPETWRVLREAYGDFFILDGNGDFAWNWPYHVPVTEEPDGFCSGEALELVYGGISKQYQAYGGVGLEFELHNQTGEELESFVVWRLQILLDGCWWNLRGDLPDGPAVPSVSLKDVTEFEMPLRIFQYCSSPLPEGRYRLLIYGPAKALGAEGSVAVAEEFVLEYP